MKKTTKKLSLSKATISNLSADQLNNVKGGDDDLPTTVLITGAIAVTAGIRTLG
ncbi:MAG: rSAM-modified peptide [bacterium]|nr:rSAM-modified peptide [bacterium]